MTRQQGKLKATAPLNTTIINESDFANYDEIALDDEKKVVYESVAIKRDQKIRKSRSPDLKQIINPKKKSLQVGIGYWKNGLASSVVTIKKDQRSILGSFEAIKPKLAE